MHPAFEAQPIDVRLDVVGNRLIGVDIYPGGNESCLRSDLGTYKTQEHAEAFKLLMSRVDFLILASEGKITEETVDRLAAELVRRKAQKC